MTVLVGEELKKRLRRIISTKRCNDSDIFDLIDTIEALQEELQELRTVSGEAYQAVGGIAMEYLENPVKLLDNLSAASRGLPLPHRTCLPVRRKIKHRSERNDD